MKLIRITQGWKSYLLKLLLRVLSKGSIAGVDMWTLCSQYLSRMVKCFTHHTAYRSGDKGTGDIITDHWLAKYILVKIQKKYAKVFAEPVFPVVCGNP